MAQTCLQPDWLWTEQGFRANWQVRFEQGRIVAVEPAQGEGQRLPRQALLPGLTNAHSHAFQRLIRGRTERRDPARPHDDFWTWREQMYAAAMTLNPEQLESVARLLYVEMLEAGITTVGEFHYLHHQPSGAPYEDPDELALRLQAAAQWAGIELVLLRCAYHRAGWQVPANPRQVRFLDNHWEDCLAAVERLRARGLAVGVAPHSLRAVPASWLKPLAEYARRHDLPLHMHVSEQTGEIDQVLAEHGRRPVQLLADSGVTGPGFTAVHAIHLNEEEIALMKDSRVCSCPTTERNLGDGVVPARALRVGGTSFALGTDSQCQVDLWEDARQLDYHLRLWERQRAVLDTPPGEMAGWLRQVASEGGARALGREAGSMQEGFAADFVSLDLDHPALVCEEDRDLLDSVVWAAGAAAVSQVWVAGEALLERGRHRKREQAVQGYRELMRELIAHG